MCWRKILILIDFRLLREGEPLFPAEFWLYIQAVASVDGTFATFTGDQLGTLFASRVLARYKESRKPLGRLLRLVHANSLTTAFQIN